MTTHEKDLLMSMLCILFFVAIGSFMSIQILNVSLFFILLSTIRSLGSGIMIFILLGLVGSYYEITLLSHQASNDLTQSKSFLSSQAIGGNLGIIFIGILLALPVYIWGNNEAILRRAYLLIIGGFGFSLVIGMMLVGAIIARFRYGKS